MAKKGAWVQETEGGIKGLCAKSAGAQRTKVHGSEIAERS